MAHDWLSHAGMQMYVGFKKCFQRTCDRGVLFHRNFPRGTVTPRPHIGIIFKLPFIHHETRTSLCVRLYLTLVSQLNA